MLRRPSEIGLQHRPVIWDMLGVYFLVAVWEFLTVPMVSHSDSWRGVWVSLVALPISAWYLATPGGRRSSFFIYGAAGSLIFIYRFLNMDRFQLWLQYQAPSTEVIVISWVLFTLGMGAICWYAAILRTVN